MPKLSFSGDGITLTIIEDSRVLRLQGRVTAPNRIWHGLDILGLSSKRPHPDRADDDHACVLTGIASVHSLIFSRVCLVGLGWLSHKSRALLCGLRMDGEYSRWSFTHVGSGFTIEMEASLDQREMLASCPYVKAALPNACLKVQILETCVVLECLF
jgi:hypothetical protein